MRASSSQTRAPSAGVGICAGSASGQAVHSTVDPGTQSCGLIARRGESRRREWSRVVTTDPAVAETVTSGFAMRWRITPFTLVHPPSLMMSASRRATSLPSACGTQMSSSASASIATTRRLLSECMRSRTGVKLATESP